MLSALIHLSLVDRTKTCFGPAVVEGWAYFCVRSRPEVNEGSFQMRVRRVVLS